MVAEIGKLKYETLTHVIDVIAEVLGGERRGE
jgi:hypothetical protein